MIFNLFKKRSTNISLDEGRKIIIKKLKEIIVPKIKGMGFEGSFPHFRRINANKYEFLSFQFNKYGGSFVLEVGSGTKEDLPVFARDLPFEKLNYSYVGRRRRIQPDDLEKDFWFSYGNFTKDEQFENLARLVISVLPKAEEFFGN